MTDKERLVAVETKLTLVQETVNKIDQKLDVFATLAQLSEVKQGLEEKILDLHTEIIATKKRSAVQTWVTGTLSAILGSVLTILIQSYFSQ